MELTFHLPSLLHITHSARPATPAGRVRYADLALRLRAVLKVPDVPSPRETGMAARGEGEIVSRRLVVALVTAGFLGPVLAAAPAHGLPLDQAADG